MTENVFEEADRLVESDKSLFDEIRRLSGFDQPEPVAAKELEEIEELASPPVPEPELQSGTLVLRFQKSVVKRDEAGRIIEIVGEGTRKTVKRDEGGRIVEIIEESEEELQS
jgi:hypothetical protein